jgi:hypothetical protein
MGADTVFISYSHDSPEHSDRVLALANALISVGLDVELDQFVTWPEHGWPHWCAERLEPENARFVLVVCTPTYHDRVRNKVAFDEGRGAFWEGALIHQYIYEAKGNTRFIPVLLGDAPLDGVPMPLRPYPRYRLNALEVSDPEFEALYRRLTGQPEIVRPERGQRVVLPPRSSSTSERMSPASEAKTSSAATSAETEAVTRPVIDISRIDRYAPKELIGREAETKLIDDAWAKAVADEAHPRVMTFVALGGEGKTALVAKWAIGQSDKDWPGCEAAFGWSFYSQGSSEQQAASSDLFLAEALKFFAAPAVAGVESAHDKGQRLAKWIAEKRAVLLLDGLEPLQYPPTSPTPGELKDQGLRALLKSLAQRNKGLCLVTTRYRIKDLEGYAATAPQRDLAPLSKEAGAKLLKTLEVTGTQAEREKLSEDVKGHALTLNIIGAFLRDAHGGDIRKRDLVKLEEADAEEQGGHAFRAMDAYAEWFEGEGEKGARALAMLRLLGLFDRPAEAACLKALWETTIEGLTKPLIGMNEPQRNIVLKRLADAKLVTVNRDAAGALLSLDAHPLLREYFALELRENRQEAWKAAHSRLYEHLAGTKKDDKPEPTLEDLQPLYHAIAHGCHAGLQQEACDNVYFARICRRAEAYVVRKLGAFGADLGAVACFFDPPWRQVSPNLSPRDQAWLLGEAGFRLRALGRLTEALEPMRAGLEPRVATEDWENAAISAGNLTQLELTLGDVGAAIRDGEIAAAHADRSGDAFQRLINRTTQADALHQADRRDEARALFVEAEVMQAEWQPGYPLLYSARGFHYCDLMLADAERSVWKRLLSGSTLLASLELRTASGGACGNPRVELDERHLETALGACREVSGRGKMMFEWRVPRDPLLDIELDHLTLARAALYRAILRGEAAAGEHMKEGLEFLRRAGAQEFIPPGILTRALFRATTGAFDGARDDLNETFEIAERGPMKLHLADIHLHRARLFGLMANRPLTYPWTSPRDDLDQARKLIEECGYGRRREELADAETAFGKGAG